MLAAVHRCVGILLGQAHFVGKNEDLLENILELPLESLPELGQGTVIGVRIAGQEAKGN
ncbi:MAG TPA: hypothetical protein PLR37_17450 [Candidatus Accumulibacter phosphatis]|nr:hypothetical protein [Candidatus Accumulibacter phosphatis]